MPHTGLIDTNEKGSTADLQRARLHLRAARRRLRESKTSLGVVTLYDALLSGMQWHFKDPERRQRLSIPPNADPGDELVQYAVLIRSGILDGRFDFIGFRSLAHRAMEEDIPPKAPASFVPGAERILEQLGVLPFDESSLPAEPPGTE